MRSQATVLKKAVLDEQSKNVELKEHMKDLEQKVRKHDQEMDSLIFRNEQLTKRISVLQQELLTNSHGKKSKNKQSDNTGHSIDFSVIDEELHKKILQNAELVSTVSCNLHTTLSNTLINSFNRWPIKTLKLQIIKKRWKCWNIKLVNYIKK